MLPRELWKNKFDGSIIESSWWDGGSGKQTNKLTSKESKNFCPSHHLAETQLQYELQYLVLAIVALWPGSAAALVRQVFLKITVHFSPDSVFFLDLILDMIMCKDWYLATFSHL